MIEHLPDTEEARASAARRLLEALSEPQARGARSDVDARMIVVLAPRNGVTVVRANVPAEAADRLVARRLAGWRGEGRERRLLLTAEGQAHLRQPAPQAPPRQPARQVLPRQPARDAADPFQAPRLRLARRTVEKGAPPVLHNEGESPLAWLARRKDRDGRPFLEPAHIEAGERFRRDVTRAQILQRVTADWEASVGAARGGATGGGAQVTEAAIDARRRLMRAFDAIGHDLAGLLTDVCGYLKGLELVESERGWPARSGKIVLRIALERLALHYGLESEARGRSMARSIIHWGAEDYRPEITPG